MKISMCKLMLVAVLMMGLPAKVLAGEGDFIGEVSIFAGDFAPRNYAFCDGQLLSVSGNQALFSLLGNRYGGDGVATFALPNLAGAERPLNGARYIIALDGLYPPRN